MFKSVLILLAVCACSFCKECNGGETLRPSERKCACPEKHILARESQNIVLFAACNCPRMINHVPNSTPDSQAETTV